MRFHTFLVPGVPAFFCAFFAPFGGHSSFADDDHEHPEMVAGKADLLRQVPKKFATLVAVNAAERQVTLRLEGEEADTTWNINPDAELKIHGWWGRLEQLKAGDRVWAWFSLDRKKQPKSVLMLADELSEQDIHGQPPTLMAFDASAGTATLKPAVGDERTLKLAAEPQDTPDLASIVGKSVFVQSAGDAARLVATADQLEALRFTQKEWLTTRWREEGLPGFVSILHPLGGELEIMLDHEGMRWGRYLKSGDEVTIDIVDSPADEGSPREAAEQPAPVKAKVRHVRPWRERTQLRLVTGSGVDQADFALGQRVRVHVPEPPKEVQESDLPSDIGRLTDKTERVEWFIASIYCSCQIGGDGCTGMFYSLASCNVRACGMPNTMRGRIGKLIEEGKTDEEIWRELHKSGPLFAKQHLLR
jgi:hypothetical protein